MYNKSVDAYLSSFVKAKFEWLKNLEILAYKGAEGGLDNINEYYLYFKYIIRGGWKDTNSADFLEDWTNLIDNAMDPNVRKQIPEFENDKAFYMKNINPEGWKDFKEYLDKQTKFIGQISDKLHEMDIKNSVVEIVESMINKATDRVEKRKRQADLPEGEDLSGLNIFDGELEETDDLKDKVSVKKDGKGKVTISNVGGSGEVGDKIEVDLTKKQDKELSPEEIAELKKQREYAAQSEYNLQVESIRAKEFAEEMKRREEEKKHNEALSEALKKKREEEEKKQKQAEEDEASRKRWQENVLEESRKMLEDSRKRLAESEKLKEGKKPTEEKSSQDTEKMTSTTTTATTTPEKTGTSKTYLEKEGFSPLRGVREDSTVYSKQIHEARKQLDNPKNRVSKAVFAPFLESLLDLSNDTSNNLQAVIDKVKNVGPYIKYAVEKWKNFDKELSKSAQARMKEIMNDPDYGRYQAAFELPSEAKK